MTDSLRVLGARGSVPVSGERYARFGGQTTCFFLRLGGTPVILDAGSGLMDVGACLQPEETQASLLLTHPHADHLLGFPLCPPVMRPGFRLDVFAATRYGLSAEEQIGAYMSPPLWPVEPKHLPGDIEFHELTEHQQVGAVAVQTMEGIHPGGVSILRLSCGEKSVVLATDCTLTDTLLPMLAEFASGCDLLLCDGQYSPAEWELRSNFGHSTWTAAALLGQLSGAKETRIIHHDPGHDDAFLLAAEDALRREYPRCAFAREGEEVLL